MEHDHWLCSTLDSEYLSNFRRVLTKAFATSATNGAGGVGGTFAPSLYVGCMTGFLFAFVSNMMGFETVLSTKNFALIGMAGVMAGVMHAPLMAIFLTAEQIGRAHV